MEENTGDDQPDNQIHQEEITGLNEVKIPSPLKDNGFLNLPRTKIEATENYTDQNEDQSELPEMEKEIEKDYLFLELRKVEKSQVEKKNIELRKERNVSDEKEEMKENTRKIESHGLEQLPKKETEAPSTSAEARRRLGCEMEEQERAAGNGRRVEIEQRSKTTQERQKKNEGEIKSSFLIQEHCEQDIFVKAKADRLNSMKSQVLGKTSDQTQELESGEKKIYQEKNVEENQREKSQQMDNAEEGKPKKKVKKLWSVNLSFIELKPTKKKKKKDKNENLKEINSSGLDQKKQKERQLEALRRAEEIRKQREYEFEQKKKATAEKRRAEIARKRKIAQEEQKKKEAERKQKFLAEEKRKQDLIVKGKGKKAKPMDSGLFNKLKYHISELETEKEQGGDAKQSALSPPHFTEQSSLGQDHKYKQQLPQQTQSTSQPTSDSQEQKVPSAPAFAKNETSELMGSQHSTTSTKIDKKCTEMQQSVEIQKVSIIDLKHNILRNWALRPPQMQYLRSTEQLLCNIHTVYPPAFGVSSHPYFAKWTIIHSADLSNKQSGLEEEKLKKAVRKVRLFLHPDRLPHDLDEEQQFVCKLLWDVTSDSWDEFQKVAEDLDW
eukprot:CAMPEP_0194163140 /NCGR_PEP_ID=MMETSP0152-20130528/79878_1 /TAXON_ID=1049557 /ORGANISM="Thalassiothrix antarctica, Strain L6-D1" /LENGTH=608 /DNA_ID=CAMNT_0038873101 /DNA_START=523 /DNA_END=2347 /DNA_ORIENTATION=+